MGWDLPEHIWDGNNGKIDLHLLSIVSYYVILLDGFPEQCVFLCKLFLQHKCISRWSMLSFVCFLRLYLIYMQTYIIYTHTHTNMLYIWARQFQKSSIYFSHTYWVVTLRDHANIYVKHGSEWIILKGKHCRGSPGKLFQCLKSIHVDSVCMFGCDMTSAFLRNIWKFFIAKECRAKSWLHGLDKLPGQQLDLC